jgi:hypothetical protein
MGVCKTCAIEPATIAAWKNDLTHHYLHLFVQRFTLTFQKVRQHAAIDSADETTPITIGINLG